MDQPIPEQDTNHARKDDMADSGCEITDRLYRWCHCEDSVSSILAANADLTPAQAWDKLFESDKKDITNSENARKATAEPATDEKLRRTRECGKWGPGQPSELFTRMYHDALCTLEDDPKRGVVSPCLMGSSGTVPLTIISVLPDIVRHMSNLIVRAEKEVFLATNFWQNGVATRYITNAMRELSRRAEARGTRIVMKIIYDRGNPKQLIDPHHSVPESGYTGNAVNLPPAKDIPMIDLQVINYHQPLVGTFHAKYMVVDRKIGVVQSDNIQDNDNLEMMVHIEGPIVDSLYDVAMISWHKKLDPPMPCLHTPAAMATEPTSFGDNHANLFSPTGAIKGHSAVVDPAKMPSRNPYGVEALSVDNSRADAAKDGTASHSLRDTTTDPHETVQRSPSLEQNSTVTSDVPLGAQNTHDVPAVQPSFQASKTWPDHTSDDPHYDTDIAGEVLRVQATISSKPNESRMQAVSRHLNHTVGKGVQANAPDCDPVDEMTPYIPHAGHEPFPIALVNRAPYGRPKHKADTNPQNAAWLSALRNARRNVFIQTPTLNAQPLIPAIMEACERGLDVYCYVCLGYNDAGEMLPLQGGHNEKVVNQLYTKLSPAGKQHLKWYWYVAKDQSRPIPALQKKRSCHIKLMIVDEELGIIGNGNQDTQSWYHSQEINLSKDPLLVILFSPHGQCLSISPDVPEKCFLMIVLYIVLDSPAICRAWIDGLRRNQNTGMYGAVDPKDGIWRDEQGQGIQGTTGVSSGTFPWLKGVAGAVDRLRGTGGF
ncbi:phospholipase D/nuclease [Astrocystis sublimbata]|nr:phospholipase D/nuclease [Astrocystis sublimbata]